MESTQQHVSSSTLIPWTNSPSLYVESRLDLTHAPTRTATFLFYPPSKVPTASLAAAGFYFTGDGDICRCYMCKIELKQLKFGDNPAEIHRLVSPHCPLPPQAHTKKLDSSATQYVITERCRKPKIRESIDKEKIRKENEKLRNSITCRMCRESSIQTAVLPCHHFTTCDLCTSILDRCFVCNQEIRATVRVYISSVNEHFSWFIAI